MHARVFVCDGIIFNIFHYQMCLSHKKIESLSWVSSILIISSYILLTQNMCVCGREEAKKKEKNVKFILRLCLLLSVVCRWLSNSITEGELPVNNPAIWVLSKSNSFNELHTLCGSFSSVSVEEVWGILMTAFCCFMVDIFKAENRPDQHIYSCHAINITTTFNKHCEFIWIKVNSRKREGDR